MCGTSLGDAEPRFELGPALQQASALPSLLRCTTMKYTIKNDAAVYHLHFTALNLSCYSQADSFTGRMPIGPIGDPALAV
jgi:hypothetical protein